MARRALFALGLLVTLVTCRDGSGPQLYYARVAVAPIFPSDAGLAAFGLSIDGARFVVVRRVAPPDTLADTTVSVAPDARTLDLRLRVPVASSPETLLVSIVALAGAVPLFQGAAPVEVSSGVVSQPTEIPVTSYVGPGAGVDSIAIAPRIPFIFFGDSLRFQVLAFQAGVPVPQFYVSWTTSDTNVARISGRGVLRAAAFRTSLHVVARTPGPRGITGGVLDSVMATFQPLASRLMVIGGAGQSGIAGLPLALPLEVEVRAADNLPVGGVAVRFRSPSGIGAVTDSVAVTDAAGRARTTATLGSVIGPQTFEARVNGLTGSPATFGVTALAGSATQLLVVADDGLLATVNTLVPTAPSVRAQDQFGNPVPGAAITFAVSQGGGRISGPAQLTRADGIATAGGWTLGTVSGANALTATLAGLTPVTFTATGLAGAATQIVRIAGDGQAAVVNTILPTAAAVLVRDQFNNPVPGVPVLFATASGGGSVTGGSAVTDTSGVARVGSWQLGTLVGENALTATASVLTGRALLFTASGIRDVAAQLLRVSIDTQTATAGQAVSTPPAVRVADQFGNPIPGAPVTFALTGALLGSLTPSSATTDSLGVARVTSWTLALAPGLNTLDAAVPGLAGSPMTFSATGIVTTATNMVLSGGDGQSGIVGAVLPAAYSVVVTNGITPVQGVPVHWAAGPAGGSMNPATSVTDVSGIASSTRTLGPGAGTQTATASVGGLTGSPVTFAANALPGAAARLVKQSADPQTGTVATTVTAPVVKVADQFGNGVAGVIVDFAATGGGALGATKDTSDALGVASAGSWILGNVVGPNTVTATAGALPAKTFTATSVTGAPARLAFLTEPTHALAGDTIAPAVQVAIQDQYGNLALSAKDVVSLRLGATPNPAAKLQGIVDVAAVNGVASFPSLAVDSAGLGYTLDATSGSLTGATSTPFDIGGVIGAIRVTQLGPVAGALNTRTRKIYVPGASLVSVLLDDKELLPQIGGLEALFGVAANAATSQIYVSSLAGLVVIDGSGTPDLIRLTIPVGTGAKGVAVDERTNFIYVAAIDALRGVAELVPVDGSKNIVVTGDIVQLPAAGEGVALNPKDGLLYVTIPGLNEVAIIDPTPGAAKLVGQILLGKGGAAGVAVDASANVLYVTNRAEGTVSVIDLLGRKEITRLAVGLSPEAVSVDAARGVVYVANSAESTVSLIDGARFTVVATLTLAPTAALTPRAVVVEPVSGRVYVPTKADDVVRVIQP